MLFKYELPKQELLRIAAGALSPGGRLASWLVLFVLLLFVLLLLLLLYGISLTTSN